MVLHRRHELNFYSIDHLNQLTSTSVNQAVHLVLAPVLHLLQFRVGQGLIGTPPDRHILDVALALAVRHAPARRVVLFVAGGGRVVGGAEVVEDDHLRGGLAELLALGVGDAGSVVVDVDPHGVGQALVVVGDPVAPAHLGKVRVAGRGHLLAAALAAAVAGIDLAEGRPPAGAVLELAHLVLVRCGVAAAVSGEALALVLFVVGAVALVLRAALRVPLLVAVVVRVSAAGIAVVWLAAVAVR